ncbi:MAG: hypothetical protein GEU28_09690 [Dehalococcoidia bacterium]|nr:hypothetical protein [Dehalococcoidia bacterium]
MNKQYLPAYSALRKRRLSRRSLLRGTALGGAGLAAAAFVGCGDDDDDDDDDDDAPGDGDGGASTPAAGGDDSTPAAGAETEEEGEDDGGGSGEVENVSFAYGFPAPHAGILFTHYAAAHGGFWEEEGLEIEFLLQTAGVPLLAGGTVEYAEVSCDELLNAIAAGQELLAVYQPTYGQQFAMRVPVDSEITEWTAEQLEGTAIGITELAGGEVPILRAALSLIDLEEGLDVEFYPTSGASQAITVDAFNTDRIQVFCGSILDQAAIEVAGLELRDITPQAVLDASGDNAIGVRTDYLAENREQVVRFCRGLAKAKVWAFANVDAAIELALSIAPETGSVEEVSSFVDLLHINRALPPESAGIEEGEIWVDGWNEFQQLLIAGGTGSPDDPLTFTEPLDISLIVDNSLLAEIWDFDRAEVEARTITV